jgi:flagellar motor protein MotB
MKISTLLLTSLFAFGIFSQSMGQVRDSVHVTKRYDMPRAKTFRTWDVGGFIGLTYPNTDIAASDLFGSNVERELAYGLSLTKFFTHNFALRAQFITGKMSGKDLEKPDEFFYTTKIKYDISINAVIQIGNIAFLKRNPNIAVYGYVGLGQIYFDPSKSWYVQDNYILQDTSIVNYHNTKEIIFPFGLGAKYRISKDFSLNVDYSLRITNTDKMDGYFRLLSENDDYSYFHIGLTYHIGRKEKVLEWHNPVSDMYADLAMVKDKVDLLTKDTDKDGVADIFDREPDTPEGVKVYGDGTSVDSDGDGVPDFKDTEPFTAKGVKVDAAGKEIDEDGDGIPDSRDLEPNTPKGSLVTNKGVTIPTNEEGGNSALNVGAGWLPSVFFELDKSVIQKKYNETLASVALIMKNNPGLKFEVIGNCDTRANEEYNVKLGKRRAQAVKDHLVKRYGIDPDRMTIATKGKKEPITSADHAMNRRVDFYVVR